MKKSLVSSMMTVAVATAAYAAPAAAQQQPKQYVFDFRAARDSASVGAVGNTATYTSTDGTMTVTVAAWSLASATSNPERAFLGQYTAGLGVTNSVTQQRDGSYTTTDGSHTIDNVGRFDYVSLIFSTAVQLRYGALTPFSTGSYPMDNDPSVSFTINKTSNPITDPYFVSNLQLHTTELQGNMNASEGYVTNLNPGMNTGNVWTIGADRLFAMNSDMNDGFKLAGISVQIPTPEPASWAMMIGGFGVVGGTMRRRRTTTAKTAIA